MMVIRQATQTFHSFLLNVFHYYKHCVLMDQSEACVPLLPISVGWAIQSQEEIFF